MKIAIVGAGRTGLQAARIVGEDPRHVTTVFETRARFGGPVDALVRLGVTLRSTAQVERLAVDAAGADLWIHGLPERFDLALLTTSEAEARALLARSGIRRDALEAPLAHRVYFRDLARMAADHPAVRPRATQAPRGVRLWVRRAARLTAAHVDCLDLSGRTWPLETPAVYVANQRWILDVARRHLLIRRLRTPAPSYEVNAGELEGGGSMAFVVGADAHDRAAARAALAVNAPIVPLAATRRRARPRVVIGEPFYAETSSIDELLGDMEAVVRHLEQIAGAPMSSARPGSHRRHGDPRP